jgi:hypothetical protein
MQAPCDDLASWAPGTPLLLLLLPECSAAVQRVQTQTMQTLDLRLAWFVHVTKGRGPSRM